MGGIATEKGLPRPVARHKTNLGKRSAENYSQFFPFFKNTLRRRNRPIDMPILGTGKVILAFRRP